jgi:HK97 family phage major capsid protein
MEKREFQIEIGSIRSSTERTVAASLSSEFPVMRFDGKEVLSHDPAAVDLSRAPLPLICSHNDKSLPVGIVEGLRVADGKLKGVLRFSGTQDDLWKDVEDGIIRNLSIGYIIQQRKRTKDGYMATKWQPYECSIVAAPADPSVGIGRNFNAVKQKELNTMDRNDLLKEKKRVVDAMATLAAKDEMNAEETKQYDDYRAEVAALERKLEVINLQWGLNNQDDNKPDIFIDGNNGNTSGEIRLLTPKERVQDHVQHDLPDGIQPGELSLGRMLKGCVLGDWSGCEVEKRATLSEGTAGVGGHLVPTPLSSKVIDLARNASVVGRAGALTVPMETQTLKLVKITQDPTGYWRAENADITESDMAFSALTLTAKALGCLVRVSIELLEDASNASSIIESAIAKALALELDRVGLFGSGSGAEPAGLFGTTGINEVSMGTNGAALADYDPFSQAAEAIWTDNGTPGVAIFAPRTAGVLDRLRTSDDVAFAMPESFKNLRKLVSNQVPIDQTQGTASNASCALTGDFSNMLIGMRKNIVIEATRSGDADTFKKMQVLIRAYLRADIGIAKADQFCQIVGIIPAA